MNDLIKDCTRDVLIPGEVIGGVQIVEYAGYKYYDYFRKNRNTYGRKREHYWKIKCLACGKEKIVMENTIKRNPPLQSCGCLAGYKGKEAHYGFIHGMSHTRLYDLWHAMKNRCYSPFHKEYHMYGGRGIRVCDEWYANENGFINFAHWAYNHGYDPKAKYISVERIDTNGNYCPENCTFARSASQQCNNKTNNVEVNWGGVRYTLTELCRHFGKNDADIQRVFDRMHDGKSLEDAVLMPKTRTGNAGRVDREKFMNDHPLVSDGTKIFQNPNAVNPFVSCKYPDLINTNDPKLTYMSNAQFKDSINEAMDELAAMRGISPVPQETEEEYQKAREIAKQNLINYLRNQ